MFLTSFLLIKYWLFNKAVVSSFEKNHKYINKFVNFGIASAIALTIHSIFLGIDFDNNFYKLFRRVVMLMFIIFEIVAQAYLVATLYSFKDRLYKYINTTFLTLKLFLVSILIVVAIISVPIISLPGDNVLGFNVKFFKHGLEWNYFIGVITFYLLTFFMWKKIN
jgi:small-conductance mechanosensitive channel